MTPARPWWRRHPWRTVLLTALLALLVVAAVLAGRALAVVRSIEPRAQHWEQRAEQPGDVVLVALGDSLTQGIGSSSVATTFVDALAEDLADRTGGTVRVVNLSVTGATTAELVAEQLPQLDTLLDRLAADGTPVGLVTLCIGANDAGRTDPEDYRRLLATALDALPPGSLVADVPDFNGGPREPAAAELSRVAREEVAARPGLVLVPLEEATADLTLADYAADFFHPSDAGYRRYTRVFREAVEASEPPLRVPTSAAQERP